MRNAQVLLWATMGAGLAAALAFASGGCGSNNSTGPSGGSSSSSGGTPTGSSSSSGGTPTGSSSSSGSTPTGSSSSGGTTGSSSGAPTSAACGLNCPSGQFCCAQRTGAVPETSCTAEANCADGGTVECISPADCTAGLLCCGASGATQPLGTKCMAACEASGALSRQVCLTPVDCPIAGSTCPTIAVTGSTAGLYKTCRAPVVDAGTTAPADAGTE